MRRRPQIINLRRISSIVKCFRVVAKKKNINNNNNNNKNDFASYSDDNNRNNNAKTKMRPYRADNRSFSVDVSQSCGVMSLYRGCRVTKDAIADVNTARGTQEQYDGNQDTAQTSVLVGPVFTSGLRFSAENYRFSLFCDPSTWYFLTHAGVLVIHHESVRLGKWYSLAFCYGRPLIIFALYAVYDFRDSLFRLMV